jgi:replicative superfamily II helicase
MDVYFKKCASLFQGTEYYDGKAKRYVDFPITDILQMMGRAGRPQYDQHGKAVILVHEPKKSFYKKVKSTISNLYVFYGNFNYTLFGSWA